MSREKKQHLQKCLFFCLFDAQISKMVEDEKMLVGVFMTSFRFGLLGYEGGRGEGDAQSGISSSLQASFSLSLSHCAFRLILQLFKQLKHRLWSTKCLSKPAAAVDLQKQQKSPTRNTSVKYAVNKVYTLPPWFYLELMILWRIQFASQEGVWQNVHFPWLYTQHVENPRERLDAVQLKRDVFSPSRVLVFVFLSWDL